MIYIKSKTINYFTNKISLFSNFSVFYGFNPFQTSKQEVYMKKARLYVLCEGMDLIFGGMMEPVMECVKDAAPEVEDFSDFGFGTAYMDPLYLLGELMEKPEEAIVAALLKEETGDYMIRWIKDKAVTKLVEYLDRNMDSGENTVTLFNRFYDECNK